MVASLYLKKDKFSKDLKKDLSIQKKTGLLSLIKIAVFLMFPWM